MKNERCKDFSQESPLVQQEIQTKFSNIGGKAQEADTFYIIIFIKLEKNIIIGVIYNRDKRLCLTCNKTYTKFKGLYNHLIYIHKLKISFIRPSIKMQMLCLTGMIQIFGAPLVKQHMSLKHNFEFTLRESIKTGMDSNSNKEEKI